MTQNKNMPEEKEAEMATLGCVFLEPKNSIILLQDMLVVDDFIDLSTWGISSLSLFISLFISLGSLFLLRNSSTAFFK